MFPEQRSTSWVKNIVQKFTKSGNLVLDVCTATFSASKSCLFHPNRRRFIDCQVHPDCATESMPQLSLHYDRQILSTKWGVDRDE